MSDFGVSFPILGVNGLCQDLEFMEHVRFANTSHFILDPSWKSIVELVAEYSIPIMDACGEVVELNQVLGDLLVVTHSKYFKVSFGFTYGVVRSKVVFEFRHKFRVVIDSTRINI